MCRRRVDENFHDEGVGLGHAICGIGWNSHGLLLRNSWGKYWGTGGNCIMPWPYVAHSVWEVWKAIDVIDPKA